MRTSSEGYLRVSAKPIPKKLKHDAIVEVVFEIRFSTSTIPEVLVGRISEFGPWNDFTQSSLPLSQIPLVMRQQDPNLKYQPVFALTNEPQKRAVRIGANSIAYSRGMPYVGWDLFKPEVNEVILGLFTKANDLQIERLGLRYLNALREDLHGIRSLSDLDLRIQIEDEVITQSANLNLNFDRKTDTACILRVATPDIVLGQVPAETAVYVDVDIFTGQDGFLTSDRAFVEDWVERAHQKEKEQFFRMLPKPTIDSLREN